MAVAVVKLEKLFIEANLLPTEVNYHEVNDHPLHAAHRSTLAVILVRRIML